MPQFIYIPHEYVTTFIYSAFIFSIYVIVQYFSSFSKNKNVSGKSKSTSLTHPLPPSPVLQRHFLSVFSIPIPLISFTKRWQTMTRNRKERFCILGCLTYHIISKELEKLINHIFNLCVYSLLNIDTDVLTIHVAKMIKS